MNSGCGFRAQHATSHKTQRNAHTHTHLIVSNSETSAIQQRQGQHLKRNVEPARLLFVVMSVHILGCVCVSVCVYVCVYVCADLNDSVGKKLTYWVVCVCVLTCYAQYK